MAKAFASIIIDAPVEAVWEMVRDFDGTASWLPGVASSTIEDGLEPDVVGCVRRLGLGHGGIARERLLSLDDSRYRLSYNFETAPFPVENYVARMELIPVTSTGQTFAQWSATFEEAPQDRGKFVGIISRNVFAAGLGSLAAATAGRETPAGAQRWQGLRPAKVFTSSVIGGPVEAVWARIRDFAGMGDWHDDISGMHMLGGVRSDKVSGVRDFLFGGGPLWEQLTYLSDADHAFRYRILKSDMPWLNYHAGARLRPISATGETFAVWTADWTAAPQDDLELIPSVHENVFQKAFDTLNRRWFAGG